MLGSAPRIQGGEGANLQKGVRGPEEEISENYESDISDFFLLHNKYNQTRASEAS